LESLKKVCIFLNISWNPSHFPYANKDVNPGKIPRLLFLFSFLSNIGRAFRYIGLDKLSTFFARVLKPLFFKADNKSENKDFLNLNNKNLTYLRKIYKKDVQRLSLLVDLDLDLWRTTLTKD